MTKNVGLLIDINTTEMKDNLDKCDGEKIEVSITIDGKTAEMTFKEFAEAVGIWDEGHGVSTEATA